MKILRMIFGTLFSLCAVFVCSTLFSCAPSSPLFGTWSDNLGNKITFADDYTYVATITDVIIYTEGVEGEDPEPSLYIDDMQSGTFSVAENVISFSTDYGTIVTEWDIRGSILYLDWTMPDYAEGEKIRNLRLYHN